MGCLHSICGVGRSDRVRNEGIGKRYNEEVGVRMGQGVLGWFSHVEMEEERFAMIAYELDVRDKKKGKT